MVAFLKKFRRRITLVHLVLAVFFLPVIFAIYRIGQRGRLLDEFTLLHSCLLFLVLLVAFYIARDIAHDVVIIDPISVPWDFESAGLTPEVMAQRVGERLRQIEAATQTSMKKDNLTPIQDDTATPDVEIPGTRMGLKMLGSMVRSLLGIYRKHVGGDIVYTVSAGPAAERKVTVTVYVTKGRERNASACVDVAAIDVDAMAQCAAEMALAQINPYVLARYRRDTRSYEEAIEIVKPIAEDSSEAGENDRYRVAALSLWGNVLADQKKFDEAIEKYQKAIELDPKDAYSFSRWGSVLAEQKKFDEAAEKYQRAVQLDPKDADTFRNWKEMLNAAGRHDEAAKIPARANRHGMQG